MTGTPITKEQLEFIVAHFSTMMNKDIAAAVGLSMSTVSNVQKRYHLKKSPEHMHENFVKCGKASAKVTGGIVLTPEIIAKRAESYVKRWKSEKARVAFGLPQETKIRVKKAPKRKTMQRLYLVKRGYVIDDKNLIAYYTSETKRATRLENIERGVKKGAIRPYYSFKPLTK